MPKRQPCSGCNELMFTTPKSLPEGKRLCHPCRRERNARRRCAWCADKVLGRGRFCSSICANQEHARAALTLEQDSARQERLLGTAARGYGAAHRKARRQALSKFRDGDGCARCARPMREGEPLDLDHTDDRSGYLGLSHRACNRAMNRRAAA